MVPPRGALGLCYVGSFSSLSCVYSVTRPAHPRDGTCCFRKTHKRALHLSQHKATDDAAEVLSTRGPERVGYFGHPAEHMGSEARTGGAVQGLPQGPPQDGHGAALSPPGQPGGLHLPPSLPPRRALGPEKNLIQFLSFWLGSEPCPRGPDGFPPHGSLLVSPRSMRQRATWVRLWIPRGSRPLRVRSLAVPPEGRSLGRSPLDLFLGSSRKVSGPLKGCRQVTKPGGHLASLDPASPCQGTKLAGNLRTMGSRSTQAAHPELLFSDTQGPQAMCVGGGEGPCVTKLVYTAKKRNRSRNHNTFQCK